MKIYKIKQKDLRNYLISFSKTLYGKITFLLSYSLPLVFLLSTITAYIKDTNTDLKLIFIYGTLITFVIGSINFYKEIKEYINN